MRRFVRTRRAERIIDIDDLQNSRKQRNLLAHQSVWISASVPVFMMMSNDRQHESQRTQRLTNGFTDSRMLLHDLPIIGRKVHTLFQDLIGNSDFSEVVKISAPTQRDLLLQGET